jgi:hypothetical protein
VGIERERESIIFGFLLEEIFIQIFKTYNKAKQIGSGGTGLRSSTTKSPKKWKPPDHGGSIYERHLIMEKLQNGQFGIANIYLGLFCI